MLSHRNNQPQPYPTDRAQQWQPRLDNEACCKPKREYPGRKHQSDFISRLMLSAGYVTLSAGLRYVCS